MLELEAIDLSAASAESPTDSESSWSSWTCDPAEEPSEPSAGIPKVSAADDGLPTQLLVWRPKSAPSTRSELAPGSLFGDYRILRRVGSGGMGDVYSAVDRRLGRRVALKVLADRWHERGTLRGTQRGTQGTRFCRETRAMATINHPNVVTLYTVERARGRRFLTMEWIDGGTLAEGDLCRSPLDIDRFLEIAIPLTAGLSAVHAQGIAHRDLKPANVMIDREGRVKLLDFGLARWHEAVDVAAGSGNQGRAGGSRDASAEDNERTSLLPLTRAGELLGTPSYMSPEQLRGVDVGVRSDVFSAGVLFYQLLSGQRPFRGGTSTEVAAAILRDEPPCLGSVCQGIPRGLRSLVRRCLDKDPRLRFADGSALHQALVELQERRQSSSRSASFRARSLLSSLVEWFEIGKARRT